MFSSRVPGDLGPNTVAAAVERMRLAGHGFDDLTISNPTQAGIEYPPGLLDGLSDPRALRYEPQPLGLLSGREAVATQRLLDQILEAAGLPTREQEGRQWASHATNPVHHVQSGGTP